MKARSGVRGSVTGNEGKRNAQRALKEIGLSARRNTAPKSNPGPGTRISKPVLGCELFVAQGKDCMDSGSGNKKLFTVIHRGNGWCGRAGGSHRLAYRRMNGTGETEFFSWRFVPVFPGNGTKTTRRFLF
jgi:hypothetical protein